MGTQRIAARAIEDRASDSDWLGREAAVIGYPIGVLLRGAGSPAVRQVNRGLTASYHRAMETTKLSSKGQVVLSKSVREEHGWAPGTEFEVESTADGVRLRAKAPFPRTELAQVFGSAPYAGPTKTLEEMDEGIRAAVARRYRRAVKR